MDHRSDALAVAFVHNGERFRQRFGAAEVGFDAAVVPAAAAIEPDDLVIRLTRSKSRIVSKPLPSDDPERRRPDTSLARERLGWQPSTALDDGLRKTIAYFDKRLSEARPAR